MKYFFSGDRLGTRYATQIRNQKRGKMKAYSTKHSNKTSQKYEGVRSKELNNGDIAYYVRWSDKNGVRLERKVGTKNGGWNEKKASLKRIELQSKASLENQTKNQQITISSIMERYLEIQKLHLGASSYKNCKGECLVHINPFFGSYPLESITPPLITDFMLSLNDKSNKTINKLIDRLSHIIEWCIKEYNLSLRNPAKAIKKLKIDNARERFLTKDEVEELLKVTKAHPNAEVYYFFVLAFSTGARLNSVRNIKLEDIDFTQGTIKIQDFKNNSKYTAFLTPLAKQTLQDYKENIIFKTPERTIVRAMQNILNTLFNAHLESNDRKHRVVIHTTRHTFASHLAIAGTPIQIIQKLLNHRDIKMTMRYAHLLPHSGREWVERLWD